MPSRTPLRRTTSAATVLAALAVLQMCLLALAPAASAHVRIETDPATGSHHKVGPSQIQVRMSQPVHPDLVEVTLRRADGVEQKLPLDTDDDNPSREYTAVIGHELSRASYMVEVSASADGHRMTYRAYFVVGPGPVVKQGVAGADTSNRTSDILNRTGSPLGLIALVGFGLLFTATLTGAPRPMLAVAARAARFCVSFGVTAVVLQLAGVVLAKDGQLAASYSTQVGRLLLLQLVTFAALVWAGRKLVAVPAMSQRRANRENALAVVGLLLTLTYAGRSHAAGDEWAFMSLMVAMVHLAAVSLWMSGLLAMATVASRDRLDSVPAVVLDRFSALAKWCATLAMASGFFLAFRLTDGFDAAALASTFGAALLGKTAMVAVLGFCAWRTHRALAATRQATAPAHPQHPAADVPGSVMTLAPPKAPSLTTNAQLTRRVLLEARIALVVLAAANVLAVWAH